MFEDLRRAVRETLADAAHEARASRSLVRRASLTVLTWVAVARVVLTGLPVIFTRALFHNAGHDVRYAWRRLWRMPLVSALAILTLGLGIGAVTAVFSVVNAVLFKMPPIPEIERVVQVHFTHRAGRASLSFPAYRDVTESRRDVFDSIAAGTMWTGAVNAVGHAELVSGELVTSEYFETMRQQAAAGQLVLSSSDREAAPSIVISDRLWSKWFRRDPGAVGRVITVAGHPLTIIGVAPADFGGLLIPTVHRSDVWMPLGIFDQVNRYRFRWMDPDVTSLRVFGRLRDGVSDSVARAAVAATGTVPKWSVGPLTITPMRDALLPTDFETIGVPIGTAFVALAALVLLIACANLTNLLLARALARHGEFAVRLSTGASRSHLARLLLAESSLMTAIALAVGLGVAALLVNVIAAIPLPSIDDDFRLTVEPSIDLRVLAFAALLALGAAFVVGIGPALRAARTQPLQVLMSAGSEGGRRGARLRALLVGTQVTVCIVLLLAAGLYLRSAVETFRHDPGLDGSRSAMARVNLSLKTVDAAEGRRYLQRALELASNIPTVTRASLVDVFPLGPAGHGASMWTESDVGERPRVQGRFARVSTHFFDQLRIPIVRGRRFQETDTEGAPRVVVINETAARRLWPGQDPIGKRVALMGKETGWREVVGVARDTDVRLPRNRLPFAFMPFAQDYFPRTAVIVETDRNPRALIEPLRAALLAIDPDIPVTETGTVTAALDIVMFPVRMTAAVLGGLSAIGLFLALLGLYSVVSYAVRSQTREIGIRMALGAERAQIHRLVLRHSLRMLIGGVVPGLVLAYFSAGLLRNLLFGITPHDPLTFVLVPLVLVIVGLAATYFPARRAARIDPTVALREL